PSSLMLGVTTYITTDVAPVPLLWVLPLSLYLLTFIVAFSRPPLWLHRLMIILLPVAIIVMMLLPWLPWDPGIREVVGIHLAAFFVAALVCHGELAMSRPAPEHLTKYFLCISIGGVLGGSFNGLLAPQIFPWVIEYPAAIALVCLLRPRWS